MMSAVFMVKVNCYFERPNKQPGLVRRKFLIEADSTTTAMMQAREYADVSASSDKTWLKFVDIEASRVHFPLELA